MLSINRYEHYTVSAAGLVVWIIQRNIYNVETTTNITSEPANKHNDHNTSWRGNKLTLRRIIRLFLFTQHYILDLIFNWATISAVIIIECFISVRQAAARTLDVNAVIQFKSTDTTVFFLYNFIEKKLLLSFRRQSDFTFYTLHHFSELNSVKHLHCQTKIFTKLDLVCRKREVWNSRPACRKAFWSL